MAHPQKLEEFLLIYKLPEKFILIMQGLLILI